jgi:hypothetical protein
LNRLSGARVEERAHQQAKKPKSAIAAHRVLNPNSTGKPEFGQNDQRQQPPIDSLGLHVVGDASVSSDLADASTMKM